MTGWWILERSARRVLPRLLVAFPIVLLAIWFALRVGLRPLRQLAETIARRGATDLSPLGLEPRYTELQQLAAALEDMLRQLRDQVTRERAFVHDAVHAMRTPMAVIAAQARALTGAHTKEDRACAQLHLEQAVARESQMLSAAKELSFNAKLTRAFVEFLPLMLSRTNMDLLTQRGGEILLAAE